MNPWDVYLSTLDDSKRQIVIDVLAMAKKHAPKATESLIYGVPGLRLGGKPLIAVAAHKEHYGVYPCSSTAIEATKPLLGNHETAKGTIRFHYGELPAEELMKELIELRAQEIGQ